MNTLKPSPSASGPFRNTAAAVLLPTTLLLPLLLNDAGAETPFDAAATQRAPMLLASTVEDEKRPRRLRPRPQREREKASWAIALDNDLWVPSHRDQDFTYGVSFTYSGGRAQDFWWAPDGALARVDGLLGLADRSPEGVEGHSAEFGFFAFTPDDIQQRQANHDDRPYASLVYLASSREQVEVARNRAWHTTLSVGLLGLGLVGEFQNDAHDTFNSDDAQGWEHQVSDGGELTARYTVARQDYFDLNLSGLELKSTLQGSLGYLTEASWSLSLRRGRIHSPWWSFTPELASYGEHSSYSSTVTEAPERYLWGGIAVKVRAYNAFLQGQFRSSDVTYNSAEINHVLLEAWLGYTYAFANGYRLSYVLRGHSSEVREGGGDRGLLWGGVIIAKTFD